MFLYGSCLEHLPGLPLAADWPESISQWVLPLLSCSGHSNRNETRTPGPRGIFQSKGITVQVRIQRFLFVSFSKQNKTKNSPKCRHTPKPQPQNHQDTTVSCIPCICLALSPAPARRQDCERVVGTGGAGLCTYAVQGIRLSSGAGPASLPASWPLPLAESSSNINNRYLVLCAVNGDREKLRQVLWDRCHGYRAQRTEWSW